MLLRSSFSLCSMKLEFTKKNCMFITYKCLKQNSVVPFNFFFSESTVFVSFVSSATVSSFRWFLCQFLFWCFCTYLFFLHRLQTLLFPRFSFVFRGIFTLVNSVSVFRFCFLLATSVVFLISVFVSALLLVASGSVIVGAVIFSTLVNGTLPFSAGFSSVLVVSCAGFTEDSFSDVLVFCYTRSNYNFFSRFLFRFFFWFISTFFWFFRLYCYCPSLLMQFQ